MGNSGMIAGAFSSDTTLPTPVPINKGGTGETSAQAALDALAAASGSLVQGDILIVDSSTNLVRLARGSDNYVLTMNGSNPNWEASSSTTPLVYFSVIATNGSGGAYTTNASRVCNLFNCNANDTAGASRAELDMIIDSALTLTRLRAICHNNTKDEVTNVEFEDDASVIETLALASGTAGEFDSGSISDSITAGSKLNWDIDTSASSSGSIVLRQAVATCEVV